MLEVVAAIAVILAIAVAAVLILAATRPDRFRIQRALTINAPAEAVFPLICDFHRWGGWSPWENRDPAMKRSFGGVASGKGAVYGWEGNKNVGTGRMEIIEASAPSRIVIKLDFLKPFEAHNIAEFTMLPKENAKENATEVTWAMYGPASFLSKLMHVFIDMEKMIGRDFEAGLANLKMLTEK
jgi:hypothetical protein